jgi:hypothetical protein
LVPECKALYADLRELVWQSDNRHKPPRHLPESKLF